MFASANCVGKPEHKIISPMAINVFCLVPYFFVSDLVDSGAGGLSEDSSDAERGSSEAGLILFTVTQLKI